MGLSVTRFTTETDSDAVWGIVRDGSIHALDVSFPSHRELMASYFSDPEQFQAGAAGDGVPVDSVRLLSPVSSDIQLFCQGLNYADHRTESGIKDTRDEENLIFMKAASSICGPNDTILRPMNFFLLDYEI